MQIEVIVGLSKLNKIFITFDLNWQDMERHLHIEINAKHNITVPFNNSLSTKSAPRGGTSKKIG